MADVIVEENLVIGNFGGIDLAVDVSRPANAAGYAPGLLFLPGGGWATANREPLKERYGIPMAERGYVCVTGEYRVLEQARWPAAIHDVKAILRWMRTRRDRLGLDPARVAVGGKSAGGHLALLAAGTSAADFGAEVGPKLGDSSSRVSAGSAVSDPAVSAVIGVAPVSDISEYWRRPPLESYVAEPSDTAITAANPIARVDANYPPTLLVHGAADSRVPHEMTLRMFHTLEQAGVPVDLALYAGQDHMFDQDPQFSRAIVEAMDRFLSRYLPVPAVMGAMGAAAG